MGTNKKILVAGIAIATVIALWIGSTSAMNGQWNSENGKREMSNFITAEQRVEVDNMTQAERQTFVEKMRAEHDFSTERAISRNVDKMNMKGENNNKTWDFKRGWNSKWTISEFINEEQRVKIRDMTQGERHDFIQKIRAEHGLSTEEMWEGNKGKRGSKWGSQSRNR